MFCGAQVLQLQKLEVLAREEMLNLVADLMEGNHPELFAEFKRMVNEAVSSRTNTCRIVPPPPTPVLSGVFMLLVVTDINIGRSCQSHSWHCDNFV